MRLDSAFPLLVLSAERRSVTSWRWRSRRWARAESLSVTCSPSRALAARSSSVFSEELMA